MKNAYDVGVGGFVVVSLYVIILAFMWRSAAARFTQSTNPTLVKLGEAMGATL